MNAATARRIEEMKKQTIGVEVEMYGITREKAARIAARFFGTGRFEDTAARNGYCAWSAWDGEGREWKFQRDVSIDADSSQQTELVTPILRYEDIPKLQELLRKLRRAGRKATPRTPAASTSTSARTDTRRRPSATSRTSWRATKAS